MCLMALSCYFLPMTLDINPRGNGACPLCALNKACMLQRRLKENADAVNPSSGPEMEMEIVIYTCPYFKERVAP